MGCLLLMVGCKFYSLSGISIPAGTETFQVNYFQNNAPLVEPGIERTFTFALQDLIQNQSSLTLAPNGGDLIYEGEIVDYYIAPQTATSDNVAAQNRLTIAINVRFVNTKVEDGSKDFTKRYSFFVDRPASEQFVGGGLDDALAEIFERITQDIFNDSLADW
ncbi:LptE family protein [Flavimarina sp. Hel_I_48]|uniref:LptE family protein n=1 Tax=Flavimarina sp. Hel_I_48 TaxID=1392488 RepID=UPI0004DEDF1D